MSTARLSGTFTADGTSAELYLFRHFNLSVQGTFVATVNIQRSFDDGATWETTDSVTTKVSTVGFEPEKGVKYRLSCSGYTSGSVEYRIGGNGIS